MSNGMPFYLQIAEEMRTNIRIEKWKEGEKIPTELDLCDIYHVSRITIRKAIEELVKEDLLIRIRPKGTFVKKADDPTPKHFTLVKSFTEEIKEIGLNVETIKINIIITHADKKLAQYLNVPVGERLILLKRLRKYDKHYFAYFLTYFKFDEKFSLNSYDYYGSFYEYLRNLDIILNNKKEIIEAIHPAQKIAYILRISQNTPVLKRTRFASDTRNQFNEYTECYYVGTQYKYYVDFE